MHPTRTFTGLLCFFTAVAITVPSASATIYIRNRNINVNGNGGPATYFDCGSNSPATFNLASQDCECQPGTVMQRNRCVVPYGPYQSYPYSSYQQSPSPYDASPYQNVSDPYRSYYYDDYEPYDQYPYSNTYCQRGYILRNGLCVPDYTSYNQYPYDQVFDPSYPYHDSNYYGNQCGQYGSYAAYNTVTRQCDCRGGYTMLGERCVLDIGRCRDGYRYFGSGSRRRDPTCITTGSAYEDPYDATDPYQSSERACRAIDRNSYWNPRIGLCLCRPGYRANSAHTRCTLL